MAGVLGLLRQHTLAVQHFNTATAAAANAALAGAAATGTPAPGECYQARQKQFQQSAISQRTPARQLAPLALLLPNSGRVKSIRSKGYSSASGGSDGMDIDMELQQLTELMQNIVKRGGAARRGRTQNTVPKEVCRYGENGA